MKAKKQDKSENAVYVGIDEPVAVRRNILEASKSMVRVLKGQNNAHLARMEKQKLIEELRAKVSELNHLVTEARHMLPHTEDASLPAHPSPKARKAGPAHPRPAPAAATNREPAPTMDKFEKELQDIEDKLKSL